MSPLKIIVDIMAVVGGVGMLVVTIVLLVLKIKSRSEHQADKKIDDDRHLNDRLKTVEMTINNITELRTALKDLTTEIQNIKTKCVAHQTSTLLADMKQDFKRASERIDVLADALRTSYVQTTVHYSDLAIINSAINALRQQTNETNNNLLALLAKQR